MKTKILFGIVIAVLTSSIAGFAQENTAKSGEESKLVFVIEPVKTTYEKGENVEFTFRLSNRSGDKVVVAKTFQLAHFVTLDIVSAEGKRAEWCGRIVGQTDLPRSFVTLSPGESVSKKLIVSCVNKDDRSRAWGYSLGAPGKYVVTGTYRLPQPEAFFKRLSPNVPAMRGPVSAQPVTVEIR
jgi:hypothetical protein